MKRLRKAFFRNSVVQSILGALTAGYVWFVRVTSRWDDENAQSTAAAWSGGTPVIIAFWHNRLFLMPYCWPSREPFHMLISAHADGRLISKAVSWLGISTVVGSKAKDDAKPKGGSGATRKLLRLLKDGASVGITPDGPRGPRMHASNGVLALAKLSGASIIPAAAATSRRRLLSTWDRLMVPLPFSRGARIWGDPIIVPRDADASELEALREQLETTLIAISNRADIMVGQDLILPASPDGGAHAPS